MYAMLQSFKQVKFPFLLRKSSFSRLWYKPDTMFFTPKAYIRIDFNCPQSNYSPEAGILTDIFTRLLMDYLNEYGKLLLILFHPRISTFSCLDSIHLLYKLLYFDNTMKGSEGSVGHSLLVKDFWYGPCHQRQWFSGLTE